VLVKCAKCNLDSYESELGFRSFVFVLLEHEQKCGYLLGQFMTSLYTPYLLSLVHLIIQSLEFLLVLLAFVGNRVNQESTLKRSKRGLKTKKQGNTGGGLAQHNGHWTTARATATATQGLSTVSCRRLPYLSCFS